MKGIALAIETIVFIILAVVVLTVLLFFFTTQGGEAQQRIQLEQKRASACGSYLSIDPLCNQDGYAKVRTHDESPNTKDDDKILKNIGEACTKLKLFPQHCTTSPASIQCVQACCISCPTKPA